ncbi:MAG: Fic family protein, partial [Bdellovibrionota bacterium]
MRIFSKFFLLVGTLVSFAHAQPAWSASTCEALLNTELKVVRPTIGAEIALRLPVDLVAQENFPAHWGRLMAEANKRLGPKDAKELEEWVLTNFFVDRPMTAVRPSKDAKDMEWMWNNTGGRPIQNFFTAFRENVVVPTRGADLLANWKEMHRTLMHYDVKISDVVAKRHSLKDWIVGLVGGNVESIDTANIGKFRSTGVRFHAENNRVIDYKINRFLTPDAPAEGKVWVNYPRIEDVAKFSDVLSPKLVADIKAASQTKAQLTERMVDELVMWAFNQHAARLATAKDLNGRIAAHVELSHRLVSIHPFANGNGRSSRFLLTTLLAKEGLPPAVLRDTWDVGLSVQQYTHRVIDGIALSRAFLDDIMLRLRAGMNPLESPVLTLTLLPTRIYFDPGQAKIGKQYFPVDIYDFAQFTREQKTPDSDERSRFRSYMRYLRTWGVFNAKTMDPYQQKLIPNEMLQTFFNVDAANPAIWKAKKDLFYRNEQVFRGLSTRQTVTDQQLLSYFLEIQQISL